MLMGVGVLDPTQQQAMSDAVLRRVFPWLLRATKKWFDRLAPASVAEWRRAIQPFELRLQDYRTAGQRTFHCDGSAWLNLVHGHNGSGKSAMVEAIELLLTNRIQRLDDAKEQSGIDYFPIV